MKSNERFLRCLSFATRELMNFQMNTLHQYIFIYSLTLTQYIKSFSPLPKRQILSTIKYGNFQRTKDNKWYKFIRCFHLKIPLFTISNVIGGTKKTTITNVYIYMDCKKKTMQRKKEIETKTITNLTL